MGALEGAQPGRQPLGRERGGRGYGQPAPVHRRREQAGRLGQPVERLAQGGQGGLGRVGQQEALGRALEERRADIVLQVLDLLGDRARRHRQLVGGAAEVQVAGGRLEGAQRVQRGQPAPLVVSFHEFS
jgi:hypothetical protein